MIEKDIVFDSVEKKLALWCGADAEDGDLARAVEYMVENDLSMVSVLPDSVKVMWPWVERLPVKILARFYLPDKKISEKQVSDLTENINTAFKHGAHGAQVFLPCAALGGLVEQTHVIRDDLFFNKDLSIGIDIGEIGPYDWAALFENLRKINVSSVVLVMAKDMGEKSDFVGRLYGMLNAWDDKNNFDVHFVFGPDFMRIEQVTRLVKLIKPELNNRVRFWVGC